MDTLTIPSMTEETVRELIALLIRHPDLRREMRKALFPELDLQKTLQELAQAQKRTEASIQPLSSHPSQQD